MHTVKHQKKQTPEEVQREAFLRAAKERVLRRVIEALTLGAFIIAILLAPTAVSAGQDKVTICHASGLAGTTKFETLTIAYPAVYGEAGHFYENGTPRAGHEQDYLGPCIEPTPTPTASPQPSATPDPSETPQPSVEPSPSPSSSIPVSTSTPSSRPSVLPNLPRTDTTFVSDRQGNLLALFLAGFLGAAAGVYMLRRNRR